MRPVGRPVDFTSALYLGLQHESWSLRPWHRLTTGVPSALAAPPGARAVAQRLAALQGCEGAILAPSTLHLFWDLFGMLPTDTVSIHVDAGAYPIARWGAERAAARGALVRSFPHHDADALRRQLRQDLTSHRRPLVVADGVCLDCGRPAPIADYGESAGSYGGTLILDDTQALGILGSSPGPAAPYGRGGGGVLRWSNVRSPDVLVVSSMAKGFGVPVAALAGSMATVWAFRARSDTRMYCSPPSLADVSAAEHALAVNRARGDALRLRLAQLSGRFRSRLADVGLWAIGGLFPVQTVGPVRGLDTQTLHHRLLELGIRTVLRRGRCVEGSRIGFLITARHRRQEIDRAADALAYAARLAA